MVADLTGALRAIHTEQQLVYPPADVARRLGISGAGLRRLAQGYERVFRPLPRDPKHGRLWPEVAVRHMETARAMVGAGEATSVEAALATLARGDESEKAPGTRNPSEDCMDVLVQVLRALRLNLEHQQQRLASLETHVRVLRAHLAESGPYGQARLVGSGPNGRARLWWRRLLPRR